MTDRTKTTDRPQVEVGDLTGGKALVPKAVVDQAATLWESQWASLPQLKRPELEKVAGVILGSFPYMGPLELTRFFDVLGGEIYPNEEFWSDAANRQPVNDGFTTTRILPDTPEWTEWLGTTVKAETIAAAYLTAVFRKDRKEPVKEANYVTVDDSLLYEHKYVQLPDANDWKTAQAKAKEVTDQGELDKVFGPRNPGQPWSARFRVKKVDWEPLAMKKARSTSARRAFRKAYSLTEARVMVVMREAQEVVAEAQAHAPFIEHVVEEVHPVAEATSGVTTKAAEVKESGKKTDTLSAADRRKMFAWANERVFEGGFVPEVGLKVILARIQNREVEDVSTKQVTYEELEQVRQALELLPLKDSKHG